MDLKFLSFAVLLQFSVAIWIETTHYELHNKVYRSMPVLETISNSHAHTTCITKCATLDQCSGSKFEGTSIETASTCKLIGYKTLDTPNQQMDIDNGFFKSHFQLCPDGFIQILGSCYKFISDNNNYDGYKTQCQGLGTNVDLIELETLEEKEAVYEYWYTQQGATVNTVVGALAMDSSQSLRANKNNYHWPRSNVLVEHAMWAVSPLRPVSSGDLCVYLTSGGWLSNSHQCGFVQNNGICEVF